MRLAVILTLLSGSVLATEYEPPPEPDRSSQAEAEARIDLEVEQSQSLVSTNTAEGGQATGGDSSTVVDISTPSTLRIMNGAVSGAGYSTAPCTVTKRSWSFGLGIGGKSEIDETCWAEYVKQAEHEREMDLQKLEIQRLQLESERARLEQCFECEVSK